MILAILMATTTGPTDADLARGVMAVRGHMKHVTPKLAAKLVKKARAVLAKPGNSWLPIEHLLGLAVNESDLKWWLRVGLDCGVSQVRVNNFARGRARQRALCWRLSRSVALSLDFTMRELSGYKTRYCKRRTGWRLLRCTLNAYNQGPSWLGRVGCRLRYQPVMETYPGWQKRVRRCRWKNRYYLRGWCFAEGIKLGRRARYSCRWALNMKWIKRAYKVRKGATNGNRVSGRTAADVAGGRGAPR